MKHYYRNRDRYFAWNGAILLVVGVILLLDRLGIVSMYEVVRFWPVLLVALGTVLMVELRSLAARTAGAVILGGGLILQAGNLGFLHVRGPVFWPLALIGLGAILLARAVEERNRPPAAEILESASEPPDDSGQCEWPKRPDFATRFWDGAERFVRNLESADGEHASVFSHVQRRVTDHDFEKIRVVAVFGAFELDLRDAGMKGDVAVVDTAAVFGGIEIIVPEDWQVVPRGAGVFGGFSDETHSPEQPTKRLIVTGAGVFGGVVITNEPGRWAGRHQQRMRERIERKIHDKMERKMRNKWQDRW